MQKRTDVVAGRCVYIRYKTGGHYLLLLLLLRSFTRVDRRGDQAQQVMTAEPGTVSHICACILYIPVYNTGTVSIARLNVKIQNLSAYIFFLHTNIRRQVNNILNIRRRKTLAEREQSSETCTHTESAASSRGYMPRCTKLPWRRRRATRSLAPGKGEKDRERASAYTYIHARMYMRISKKK